MKYFLIISLIANMYLMYVNFNLKEDVSNKNDEIKSYNIANESAKEKAKEAAEKSRKEIAALRDALTIEREKAARQGEVAGREIDRLKALQEDLALSGRKPADELLLIDKMITESVRL